VTNNEQRDPLSSIVHAPCHRKGWETNTRHAIGSLGMRKQCALVASASVESLSIGMSVIEQKT
jgi:hypothetical protein